MRVICHFVFALLLSTATYAQSRVEQQIENKRKELLTSGVDTTVIYYRYANGAAPRLVIPEDTICHTDDIKYLIWSEGEQTFIQRFDNCKQHKPGATLSYFIRTIKSNYKKLVTEKVLPPEYTYSEKGENISMTQSTSHSTFTVFEINAGNKSIRKSIDHADLGVRYLDGKHKNINYLHNLNSIQNKLKEQAEAIVKKLYGR